MPGGDGRGPLGQGPVGGARSGRNVNSGADSGGECICSVCGEKVPHMPGVPCGSLTCQKCGGGMVRGR